MTGDGLQDIVLLRSGNIAYWPNLGHGRFGAPVQMRRAPRLPGRVRPAPGAARRRGRRRRRRPRLRRPTAGSCCGATSPATPGPPQPVTVTGTPDVVDTDAVQLADLHGTGMAGLLCSRAADGSGPPRCGSSTSPAAVKPYLLDAMDNHLGAGTTVQYGRRRTDFLRDQADPATRWRTTLPFPVHVVARVEVHDADLRPAG